MVRKSEWEPSAWWIGLFIALGAAAMTTTPPKFPFAISFFGMAGLLALVWWLTSKALSKRKPHVHLGEHPSRTNAKVFALWKWGGCTLIIAATLAAVIWVHNDQRKWELRQLKGWIIPSDEKPPTVNCVPSTVTSGAGIYLAGGMVQSDHFPVVILKVKDVPRIVLDKDKNGNISITLDIYDAGNPPKIIATIDKNGFLINQNNILDFSRTRSTLTVRDQQKQVVLSVDYLNPHAISMTAVLHYPDIGDKPIVIGKDLFSFDTRVWSESCAKVTSTDVTIFSIYPIHDRNAIWKISEKR